MQVMRPLQIFLVLLSATMAGCMGREEKVKLIEASSNDDVPRLATLAKRGFNLNFYALDGLTPLIAAAKRGSSGAIEFLLDNGADPNYAGDSITTPSYWAAINCHLKAFELLAQHGGKISLPEFARDGFLSRIKKCENAQLSLLIMKEIGG